jgi:hypothetical protein
MGDVGLSDGTCPYLGGHSGKQLQSWSILFIHLFLLYEGYWGFGFSLSKWNAFIAMKGLQLSLSKISHIGTAYSFLWKRRAGL